MPKFSGRFLWMAPYALHSDAAKNQKMLKLETWRGGI